MKRFIAGLLLAVSAHAQIDVPRMVEAIIQIEAGHWDKLGGAGNMSKQAWDDRRPDVAFTLSTNEVYARGVYAEHVRWIVATLTHYGVKPTPAAVYLAWWRGASGATKILRRGPMPDVAVRCGNIYADLTAISRP